MNTFLHNGELKPADHATVSLFGIEFVYGFGVYETVRVLKGVPRYSDLHAERLMHSASTIELEHPYTAERIENYMDRLAQEIDSPAFNIKILLLGGATADRANLYMLPLPPRFPDRTFYKKGAHVITKHMERFLPQAKTLNMLPGYLAYREAQRSGAYDALIIDRDGYILEGTMTNLFALQSKTLYTAPKDSVLAGVTRANIITCAQDNGYDVKEKRIRSSEIKKYDSWFISSTSTRIMPLSSVDDTQLTISEQLRELMAFFKSY